MEIALRKLFTSKENEKYYNYFYDFARKTNLFSTDHKAYLGFSYGPDSVFLALLLNEALRRGHLKDLTLIHINHGLRKESENEAKLAENFAHKLSLPFIVENMPGSCDGKNKSNFEKRARDYRYKIFEKYLNNNHLVFLGHHIDDAYEWSLMQTAKSSEIKHLLGIPVKRGKFRRPLMCFTKGQILFFLQKNKITFCEDHTNNDIRYERNFYRHKIIPKIEEKAPNYLKHFSDRANQLASKMKVSAFQKSSLVEICYGEEGVAVFPYGKNLLGFEEKLRGLVKKYSSIERGILGKQIKKFIEFYGTNKTGEFLFSGNVKAYVYRSCFLIINQEERLKFTSKAFQIPEPAEYSLGEFKNKLKIKRRSLEDFPYFVCSDETKKLDKILTSIRKPDALKSEYTQKCLDRGFWARPAADFLEAWEKNPRFRNKKLNLFF